MGHGGYGRASLWMRPAIFEEIGQSASATPADTDELWEWAREMTKFDDSGDITQLGMNLPSWTWEYFTWIANFGGVLWDATANEPTPEHPGVLAALADLVTQVDFYGVDTLERWSAGMGSQSGAQDPWLAGTDGNEGLWRLVRPGDFRLLPRFGSLAKIIRQRRHHHHPRPNSKVIALSPGGRGRG